MARTLFFIRSSLGSSTVKASTYLTHPVFSRVSGERFFRRSAAHRAFDRQTTAFGRVAQHRFEVVCERPPAAFRRLSPSQRGRIFNLPLVRGRRERSERGGRSHTILKLQLSNTPFQPWPHSFAANGAKIGCVIYIDAHRKSYCQHQQLEWPAKQT